MSNLRKSVMVKTSLEMAVDAWLRDPREVRPLQVVLAEEGLAGTACSASTGCIARTGEPNRVPGRPSVEELSLKYERLGLTG